jgi:tetratricopeptide (TPR) repeat protein
MCLSAKANIALKKFDSAKSGIEDAIRLFPDFAGAHETLGDLMLIQGQTDVARKAYEHAMRLDPTQADILKKIDKSRALEKEVADTPVSLRRMAFEAEIAEAHKLEMDGDPKSAEMIYREILTKDPHNVEAARLLADIAAKKEYFHDAEVLLLRAVMTAPDYARAWVDLCNVQTELHKFDDAVASARKVLEIAPDKAPSHMLYASAIGQVGDHEEAVRAHENALKLSPDSAAVYCSMAHHQKTLGRTDDAIASYRRAIAISPDQAEAYWSLANLKTFRFEDAEVKAMDELLSGDNLPDKSRSEVLNALGLEFESRKDFERAFANFEACNSIRRNSETYDPVDVETTYDRIIELFDDQFFAKNIGAEKSEIKPIFVVGLPRSGSTLIEQILASHSQVDGTHELSDLDRVIGAIRRKTRSMRVQFPQQLADLKPLAWEKLGREYIERTEIFRGNAPYFVDKNPNNFVHIGILRLAIPNARIINAMRHPLDSCFGSFKQLFASGQPFTYDLAEVGEYYLQYRRLMDHWREVAPGFVLDVQYDEVVADLETNVRRILEFCGLPFEDACLRFHETKRAIRTASSEQVRRPIYSSSVNLWRHYESQLEMLIEILEPRLLELPQADRPSIMAHADET